MDMDVDNTSGDGQEPVQPDLRNTEEAAPRRRGASYRRNYRACDLCRSKKIRCDLGDLHDPRPPCVKCRREKKRCVFGSSLVGQPDVQRHRPEDSSSVNSTLRAERFDATAAVETSISDEFYEPQPRPATTRDASDRHLATIRRRGTGSISEADIGLLSPTSGPASTRAPPPQSLVDTVVRDDTDALHLLLNSTQHEELQNDLQSTRDSNPEPLTRDSPPNSHQSLPAARSDRTSQVSRSLRLGYATSVVKDGLLQDLPRLTPEEIAMWSCFPPCLQRFAGVAEVVAYLDYFFDSLNKQMPIISDWYGHHANHLTLITEDSLLCYTILTISSRYLILPGRTGRSRDYLLHDHFFKYVQEGLQSLMWGVPLGSPNGLTSVGAVESLLLLTQWQPRNLYLQTSSFDLSRTTMIQHGKFARSSNTSDSSQNRAISTMALRSDMMCWRLVSLAVTLALESEMFGEHYKTSSASVLCSGGSLRIPHLQQMLYIYVSHLATRLKRSNPLAHISVTNLKRYVSPVTDSRPTESRSDWPIVLNTWLDLIELGHITTDMLYLSSRNAARPMRDEKQDAIVRHLANATLQWWKDFEHLRLPEPFRCVMEVEYHYLRILIHSVALQAQPKQTSRQPYWLSQGISQQSMQDLELLQEVIHSCCKVYSIIIEMHRLQALRGATSPLLLRLVTVSMFGLKVLATSDVENENLLKLLDGAIRALQESAVDDLHLAGYFAQLLERLTQKAKDRSSRHANQVIGRRPVLDTETQSGGDVNHTAAAGDGGATFLTDDGTMGTTDWDDWLAFQFDPNLATIGDSEPQDHLAYQNGFTIFGGQEL